MKKILSLILIFALLLALAACAGEGSTTTGQPASGGSGSSGSSGGSVSSGSGGGFGAGTPTGPTNIHEQPEVIAPGSGSIGYVTDDVDHWARSEFNIVYFNFNPTGITGQLDMAIGQLGEVYNFRHTHQTANGDPDTFLTNLQTILIGQPDGVIVDIRAELSTRTAEILNDFGIPAVCIVNTAQDFDGNVVIPSVVGGQFSNGETQVEHLASVYQNYWGDIDSSEIALLVVCHSTNFNFLERGEGAMDKFSNLFPGQPIFYADTGADSTSAEAGFTAANAILSAHPDINYWFAVATLEDLGLGALRAIEALGMEDRVLLTSTGASVLPGLWDTGYDGVWIANYSIPPFLFAGLGIMGLLAIMDGRATMETLWPDKIAPNATAAEFFVSAGMMQRHDYQEYIAAFMRQFGVEP